MIQERTGHAIVMATQQMLRSGAGGSGQARETRLRETLGRIAGAASAIERAARMQQQEALGWMVVGTLRAMEDYAGQLQMRLGSAIRNAGVLEARVETEMPLAQESLGSAIVVATRSALAEASELAARVASVEGGSVPHGTQEIPYQAGGILLAGLFVIFWGLRAVAESGTTLPRMGATSAIEERYRKVG